MSSLKHRLRSATPNRLPLHFLSLLNHIWPINHHTAAEPSPNPPVFARPSNVIVVGLSTVTVTEPATRSSWCPLPFLDRRLQPSDCLPFLDHPIATLTAAVTDPSTIAVYRCQSRHPIRSAYLRQTVCHHRSTLDCRHHVVEPINPVAGAASTSGYSGLRCDQLPVTGHLCRFWIVHQAVHDHPAIHHHRTATVTVTVTVTITVPVPVPVPEPSTVYHHHCRCRYRTVSCHWAAH